jgi:hypothetical protein
VQDHAADQLDVVRAHVQHPPRRLTRHCKRRHQDVVEGLAAFDLGLHLEGTGAQRLVIEGLDLGLERVDGLDLRQQALDVALVLGAEDLGEDGTDHEVGS